MVAIVSALLGTGRATRSPRPTPSVRSGARDAVRGLLERGVGHLLRPQDDGASRRSPLGLVGDPAVQQRRPDRRITDRPRGNTRPMCSNSDSDAGMSRINVRNPSCA